jgi:TIR domain-containing protein
MSSLPDPRQDAFISYTHDNNLPLDENGKGWVDNFHQHLDVQLRQYTGRKVAIWRDPQLSGNAELLRALRDRIQGSDALVVILSPGYLNSEWCMSELQEFCTLANQTDGLHLNGKSRIFAVVKLPPDDGHYPTEIEKQLRYDFFEPNANTKRPDEFRGDLRNRDERYWLKLQQLAWDLKELLREKGRLPQRVAPGRNLFSGSTPTNGNAASAKKTIYLAETTADLAEQRRQIKEELKLHNYNVVPEEPLPYVLEDYREQVNKNLSQAIASINLVGRTYGIIPDGAGDRSILRLQLDLANEFAGSRPGFKRLIWMPDGWEASDNRMGQLLQELKMLTDRHTGFEFLQTSLEEFKTLMHNRLTVNLNGHAPKTNATAAPGNRLKVYLICDRRDISDAKPLINYLQKERHYDVVLPEFEEIEGEMPLSVLHQQSLLECDGVIVYWGHANSRWANSKKADLEKHAGMEKTEESPRIRPLRAKTFYVAEPPDELKDVFYPPTAPVIRPTGEFDPSLLSSFVSDLEGGNDEGGNDDV